MNSRNGSGYVKSKNTLYLMNDNLGSSSRIVFLNHYGVAGSSYMSRGSLKGSNHGSDHSLSGVHVGTTGDNLYNSGVGIGSRLSSYVPNSTTI